MKSQSAMEYLLTYGWAILIIAIVIAAFFELGLFNPYTFSPKAQPGSCYVVRPTMTGSVAYVSLQGTCTNEIPQSVALSAAQAGNSYIKINSLPQFSQFTVVGWINNEPAPAGKDGGSLAQGDIYMPKSSNDYSVEMDTNGGLKYVSSGLQASPVGSASIGGLKYGKWYMIAQTVSSSGVVVTYVYASGNPTPTTATYNYSQALYQPQGRWCIGSWGCSTSYPFNGMISNVQIYNTSLSQADVQALYKEGVGGAPIDLQDLVGWWPLNGNSNDYSGNNNGGTPTNVTFTSNWEKNYTAP